MSDGSAGSPHVHLAVRRYDFVDKCGLAECNRLFGSVSVKGNADNQLWLPQGGNLPCGF